MNGECFTSARLCPAERLPSGLHAHGTLVTIWAPTRSGPSFPHYMCQWARRLSRVKLAAICGARSAFRRSSCSNCERRFERVHCVRKYTCRFNVHVHGKTNFIFPTFPTRRGSRDGCFGPAKEEDRRASYKRRQTIWNLAREGKVVRAGHRLSRDVGGRDEDKGGGLTVRRAHHRARDWIQNDTSPVKNMNDFIWSQNQAL